MKFYKIHLLLKLTKDIKNIDKKYYSVLGVILSFINEDENIYENITISPLIQESEFEFHIKLSFFEEEVYKRFFSIMSNKINHILSIDGIPFEIQGFGISEKGQIFDPKEYFQHHQSDKINGVKLQFQSPTIIKSSPYYKLLPNPSTYVYSCISRLEKILGKEQFFGIFGYNNSRKVKAIIEDTMVESSYKLECEKVFVKGGYIPGNIGWISYSIMDNSDEVYNIIIRSLPTIIHGLRWTGLGFGTRLGLGQVEGSVY